MTGSSMLPVEGFNRCGMIQIYIPAAPCGNRQNEVSLAGSALEMQSEPIERQSIECEQQHCVRKAAQCGVELAGGDAEWGL